MKEYVDNSFHAFNVCFAKEIGTICSAVDPNSHAVMEIFLASDNLNLSAAHLKPGFAFGGFCVPEDVRGLTHVASGRPSTFPCWGTCCARMTAIFNEPSTWSSTRESGG